MKIPNDKDIAFTRAKPEHAAAAALLIYDTDPPLWNYIFSNNREAAVDFFKHQWTDENGPFRYSLCAAAVKGQKLLGIQLGQDHLRIKLHAEAEILNRFKYINYLMPPILEGVYYITFLSVDPEVRNRGLGGQLLLHAFAMARQAGYTSCQLDAFRGNRAVAFYERHGMEILSEHRVLPLIKYGVPANYRMEKIL